MSLTRIGSVMNSKKPSGGERSGFALLTVIMLTLAMAALAASAVYLAGNAGLLATSTDREREFKYGAEAAMAIGKSRLNTDPLALPDTGFATLLSGQAVVGADGQALPGLTVNLYAGKTGSTSGQFGTFASVVAEARDASGARFVRRLELTQESFARFAYFSNLEKDASGGTIFFSSSDVLNGPVWSNDIISISAPSGSLHAQFNGEVGTAKTISGITNATFAKGYLQNQPPIVLPNNTTLSKLSGYAGSGGTSFNAPVPGDLGPQLVRMRLEFVTVNLGTGGANPGTGIDEGFVRIYVSNNNTTEKGISAGGNGWLRGDWNATKANARNCGAAYNTSLGVKFFPASVHGTAWMQALLVAGGTIRTAAQATAIGALTLNQIMAQPTARCYLGGDPQLVAVERDTTGAGLTTAAKTALLAAYPLAQRQIGGDSTTFTPVGAHGFWMSWAPKPIDTRVATARPADAAYLFPLYRGLNPGTKGVITVNGTTGVSGVLRGKVTVYATGDVIVLDDQIYATNPAAVANQNLITSCPDMLGIIAGNDIWVADNALNDPPNISAAGSAPSPYRNEDDTQDLFLQGVMMALNTSFGVENYNTGPNNATGCPTPAIDGNGRGCLFLYGGLIQQRRGAVGLLSGEGYIKRYTYDHCAVSSPPPFFPTTGRFLDNRYSEIDPVRFNITALFAALTPN
jgi:hypothetical protein